LDVELCSRCLEEDRNAGVPQLLERSDVRSWRVVLDLGSEGRAHLLVRPLDAALGERRPKPGHRVDQGDESSVRVDRDRVQIAQLTHCHSAHWTVARPRKRAETERIAALARGRAPRAASARKNGNTTSPKRGSDKG